MFLNYHVLVLVSIKSTGIIAVVRLAELLAAVATRCFCTPRPPSSDATCADVSECMSCACGPQAH